MNVLSFVPYAPVPQGGGLMRPRQPPQGIFLLRIPQQGANRCRISQGFSPQGGVPQFPQKRRKIRCLLRQGPLAGLRKVLAQGGGSLKHPRVKPDKYPYKNRDAQTLRRWSPEYPIPKIHIKDKHAAPKGGGSCPALAQGGGLPDSY